MTSVLRQPNNLSPRTKQLVVTMRPKISLDVVNLIRLEQWWGKK